MLQDFWPLQFEVFIYFQYHSAVYLIILLSLSLSLLLLSIVIKNSNHGSNLPVVIFCFIYQYKYCTNKIHCFSFQLYSWWKYHCFITYLLYMLMLEAFKLDKVNDLSALQISYFKNSFVADTLKWSFSIYYVDSLLSFMFFLFDIFINQREIWVCGHYGKSYKRYYRLLQTMSLW